jgi:hypothetical protein
MRERADWNWAPALRGQYSDALDRSQSVTGTLTSPTFAIVVDFGDAKLTVNGTRSRLRAGPAAVRDVPSTRALQSAAQVNAVERRLPR